MASETISTLYPPLIDTFMPAFLQNEEGKAQFSLSPYNTNQNISRLHISLVNQYTNISAIPNGVILDRTDGTYIINGIWIANMTSQYINYDDTSGLYNLTIPQSILKTTPFSIDGYYKLQLRFDSSTSPVDSTYLTSQRFQFSEWSSVCLLKAIPKVTITLTNFDKQIDVEESTSQIDTPSFLAGIIPIVGDVKFNSQNIKAETLQSYEINIYPKNHPDNIIDSSGIIYTGNQVDLNHIYWLAGLENATNEYEYELSIKITTKNQYTTTKIYNFTIEDYAVIPFTVVWNFKRSDLSRYNITTDGKIITEEDGIINCTITTNESNIPPGYLYIKRASNLDNYNHWELISCTKHSAGTIIQTFSDSTVGSLIQYQYSVQYQLLTGQWLPVIKSTDIIYPDFYDILLSRQNKQLAIRYKESVQNLKPVVNRTKIDTLGGKYPKFAENAQMNYKQYTISGLIDAESDFNRKFLDDRDYNSQMDIYNSEMDGKYEIRNDTIADNEYAYENTTDPLKIYSHTNTVHDLYPKDNWWWEREFREEAVKWLNDGEPKLFRSMPEGNMVVMLTDISLTPEQTIGRRLYNFTATVYEIENGYSLETLSSLGIVNIINEKEDTSSQQELSPEELISNTTVGQMYNQYMAIDKNLGNRADIINRNLNHNMDGESCDLNGFDYLHTNIGDNYKYIIYDSNSALGSSYKIVENSIVLKNLQIIFRSKPTWWVFERPSDSKQTTIKSMDDLSYASLSADQKENLLLNLGYKITIDFITGNNTINTTDIFVNEKGFYQAPSNLDIVGLYMYNNVTADLNYIINYNTTYNSSDIPSSIKVNGTTIGQLNGMWTPNTYVSKLIQEKHKYTQITDGRITSQTQINDWTTLGLELTPYSVVSLKYVEDDSYNTYTIGRSGIYNFLGENFNIEEMYFLGKRMVLSTDNRQEFLDEWEYVLDDSAKIDKTNLKENNLTWTEFTDRVLQETEKLVQINGQSTILGQENINRMWNNNEDKELPIYVGYDSNEAIVNPKYNTVYGIKGPNNTLIYKIFYIDNAWYDIEFQNNDNSIAIAKVPVYGMINYKGTIVTKNYS